MVALKNLSLQGRILGLVVAGFLLCGVILGLWRQRQQTQIARILDFVQEERGQAFEKSLQSEGQKLQSYVAENSYWDELVSFTKTRNQTWAKASLSPADKAAIPFVVVLDTEFRTLYRNEDGLEIDRATYQSAAKKLSKPGIVRYFTRNAREQIVEVFVAPISKSSDSRHVGKTYGYLVAGRIWNAGVLRDLATLTGATLSFRSRVRQELRADTDARAQAGFASVRSSGWSPSPPASRPCSSPISMSSSSERLREFSHESTGALPGVRRRFSIGAFALAVLSWVHNRPLQLLDELSLREGDLGSPLRARYASPARSFASWGRLVQSFFAQKEADLHEANESVWNSASRSAPPTSARPWSRSSAPSSAFRKSSSTLP